MPRKEGAGVSRSIRLTDKQVWVLSRAAEVQGYTSWAQLVRVTMVPYAYRLLSEAGLSPSQEVGDGEEQDLLWR